MEAFDEGESREMVSKRFKIGKTTLWEWQQRKKEQEIFSQKSLEMEAIIIKSQTGMHLLNLLKNMEKRPYRKCPNFATT